MTPLGPLSTYYLLLILTSTPSYALFFSYDSDTKVALKVAQFNSPLLDALAAKSLLKVMYERLTN